MSSDSNSGITSGPQVALMWILLITTLYVPVKYYTYDPEKGAKSGLVAFAIYILLVIVGELFISLSTTAALCGETQWSTALTITLIPWIVIFGVLNVILKIFPGWLKPFSNTIGYGITKLMGVDNIFGEILDNPTPGLDADTQKTLARIYSDKSLIINEIPANPEEFANFWVKLSPLMIQSEKAESPADVLTRLEGVNDDDNTPLPKALQLFNLVRLKNIISEYVWYLLTGALVTSVGYNNLLNTGCKLSAAEMQKRHDTYMDQEAEKAKERQANPERTYKSYD